MLKQVYRIIILIIIFVASIYYFGKDIKEVVFDIDNTTMMEETTLPLVTIRTGEQIINLLHGYSSNLDANSIREALTPIDAEKAFEVMIDQKDYDIKKVMETKFGVPFYIGNDANMGMLGEWKYGMAVKKENVVGIFVGTGLGGGLIINNKLFTGKRHDAGELGHMILNTEGPYCNCGQRGCFEAYASKVAITREIKTQIKRGRKTILKDLMDEDPVIKSKALKEAIDAKDSVALEVMDKAVYYLAAGTGNLINIFSPDMVVLGGGVLESLGDYIMPLLKDYVKRFSLPELLNGTEIVRSALGDDAIIYGSLAIIKAKKG